jgi:type I restriction enzyme S subunit
MNKENKIVPELRFPEFKNAKPWSETALKNLAERIVKKNTGSLITKVFTNSAIDGIVDQREYFDKDIADKNNLENYYVVEPGDYVYNPRISVVAPVGPISKNNLNITGAMSPLYTVFRFNEKKNSFYEYYFKSNHWYESIRKVANTGARYDRISITDSILMEIPVLYPELKEQQKIAFCLYTLDKLMDVQKEKLQVLKEYKKGLMQNLFPQVGQKTPKLRFDEFRNSSDWKEIPFNKAFQRVTRKNVANNKNILTISAQKGLVNQEDFFSKNIASRDVSNYYLIKKDEFAYNKSYSKDYPMGAIKKLNKYELGVVSTLYICFKCQQGFSHEYFEHFFESGVFNEEIERIAQEGARNHGLLNVSVTDFFETLFVKVPPSKAEEQKISSCILTIDDLIVAQSDKVEQLELHKKGLMQGLFPKNKVKNEQY